MKFNLLRKDRQHELSYVEASLLRKLAFDGVFKGHVVYVPVIELERLAGSGSIGHVRHLVDEQLIEPEKPGRINQDTYVKITDSGIEALRRPER